MLKKEQPCFTWHFCGDLCCVATRAEGISTHSVQGFNEQAIRELGFVELHGSFGIFDFNEVKFSKASHWNDGSYGQTAVTVSLLLAVCWRQFSGGP